MNKQWFKMLSLSSALGLGWVVGMSSASANTIASVDGSFVGTLETDLEGTWTVGTYDVDASDLAALIHGDPGGGFVFSILPQIITEANYTYEGTVGPELRLSGLAQVTVPPPNYAAANYYLELGKFDISSTYSGGHLSGTLNLSALLSTDLGSDSAGAEAHFGVYGYDVWGDLMLLDSREVKADYPGGVLSDLLLGEAIDVDLSGQSTFYVAWFGAVNATAHVTPTPETGSLLSIFGASVLAMAVGRRKLSRS